MGIRFVLSLALATAVASGAAIRAQEPKEYWPAEPKTPVPYPKAERFAYQSGGMTLPYLVQKPAKDPLPADAPILIYLHGASGHEEQGMEPEWGAQSFRRLRTLMHERGWIYVCPREPEFVGLLADLEKRFGKRTVYLAGGSRGGAEAYAEARANPGRYAGLIIMCGVMFHLPPSGDAARYFPMPVYLVAGEKDAFSVEQSRALARDLKRLNRLYQYVEIPGGNHGAPVEQIDWKAAIDFVTGAGREQKP